MIPAKKPDFSGTAGIAGADPSKTGWLATRLSIAAYIVPFVFIYNPAILWTGTWEEIARAMALGVASAYGLAGAVNSNYGAGCRVLMLAAAVAALNQAWIIALAGVVALALVLCWQNGLSRRVLGASRT